MKFLRVLCILLLAVLVYGCKLEITVPQHGQVETESGAYACTASDTCVIEVVDAFFDEVFIAKPAPGFSFTAWRTKPKGFCGGKHTPCALSTTLFPGTPLMQFLESDSTFFLEPVFGQPRTWLTRAAMPTSRLSFGSCVVKGKIYVFGGQRVGAGLPIDSVEMYDPVTDSWLQKASLPEPRMGLAASAINNKCYIFGGTTDYISASPSVLEYDPVDDTWRSRAAMPTARVLLSSGVVDGKVYVVGGLSRPSLSASALDVVEEYDPLQNTWRTRSPMPTARGALGVAVLDDQVYAIAGINFQSLTVVERYDPATNTWTRLSDIPQARWGLGVSSVRDRIYTFGGTNGGIYDNAEEYDPAMDAWRNIPKIGEARWGTVGAELDGQIYLLGGSTGRGPGHNSLSDNMLYTP
jgi:N-acetylneuraminic acid mutarotase